MNSIDLKNRTAIVTAGARGIGFAIAKRMLASGATVLWDVDASALDEAGAALQGQGGGEARGEGHNSSGGGGGLRAAVVDVTDAAAIARGGGRPSRARQNRHSRQQCRHHPRQCTALGACTRGLAARRRGQSGGAVSDL